MKSTDRGMQICLADKKCEDRHVPDCLKCLECWLRRCLGEKSPSNIWRLFCLDLSRNSLSNACIITVMETLRKLDVRVRVLRLAGNLLLANGLQAVTEYVWANQDALTELDLAYNEIAVNAHGSEGCPAGSDAVSALLRCFYNHPAYPHILASRSSRSRDREQAVPVTLRLNGNRIVHPKTLLKEVQAKGGKQHVRICAEAEPYAPTVVDGTQEFLSIYAPDWSSQRKPEDAPKQAAVPPSHAGDVMHATARIPNGSRSRSRRRRRKEKKEKDMAGNQVPPPPVQQPGQGGGAVADVHVDDPWPLPVLTEPQCQELQRELHEKLGVMDSDMSTDTSTRDMLAEFIVVMLAERKGPEHLYQEMKTFIGEQARGLTEWIRGRLQARFGKKRKNGVSKTQTKRPASGDDAFQ